MNRLASQLPWDCSNVMELTLTSSWAYLEAAPCMLPLLTRSCRECWTATMPTQTFLPRFVLAFVHILFRLGCYCSYASHCAQEASDDFELCLCKFQTFLQTYTQCRYCFVLVTNQHAACACLVLRPTFDLRLQRMLECDFAKQHFPQKMKFIQIQITVSYTKINIKKNDND